MYEISFCQIIGNDGEILDYPSNRQKSAVLRNKNITFRTFLHYNDPQALEELTVFGEEKDGLFYNYDDRLYGKKWNEGLTLAEKQAAKGSARFYEIALNHFHDTNDVDLQHVILGCNRSSGFSYLVFGYTCTIQRN
jgi:hypothetical protein